MKVLGWFSVTTEKTVVVGVAGRPPGQRDIAVTLSAGGNGGGTSVGRARRVAGVKKAPKFRIGFVTLRSPSCFHVERTLDPGDLSLSV